MASIDSLEEWNGSAIVKLGNTSVICGLSSELIKPSETSLPDEGSLEVILDLPGYCSPRFNSLGTIGQTDFTEPSIILTKALNDAISASRCLDLKKLCIEEGYLVWKLCVKVICTNNDGNVMDASMLGIISCLRSSSLPKVIYQAEAEPEDRVQIIEQERIPLRTLCAPLSFSFAMIDNILLADPSAEEEALAQTSFSITIVDGEEKISSIRKSGGAPISEDLLFKCIKHARNRAAKLIGLIEKKDSPKNSTLASQMKRTLVLNEG